MNLPLYLFLVSIRLSHIAILPGIISISSSLSSNTSNDGIGTCSNEGTRGVRGVIGTKALNSAAESVRNTYTYFVVILAHGAGWVCLGGV